MTLCLFTSFVSAFSGPKDLLSSLFALQYGENNRCNPYTRDILSLFTHRRKGNNRKFSRIKDKDLTAVYADSRALLNSETNKSRCCIKKIYSPLSSRYDNRNICSHFRDNIFSADRISGKDAFAYLYNLILKEYPL